MILGLAILPGKCQLKVATKLGKQARKLCKFDCTVVKTFRGNLLEIISADLLDTLVPPCVQTDRQRHE